MGKTRNKSRRSKAPAPTGLPSVKETVQEIEELEESCDIDALAGRTPCSPKSVKSALESIIEKLQSKGVEEKECACCALSILCHKKDAIPELMSSNVVKVVAPLMVDSSPTVSHSTVGALRSMSACSDYEVCETMVDQDVMTPLVALFNRKYPPCEWKPHVPVEGKLDSIKEIYVEAVQLLWNLCGSSSRAVHVFCKENLLSYLMPCLNLEVYGHDVAISVAYCLYTACEDNAEISAILNETANTEIVHSLLNISGVDSRCTLLKVLAAGIFLNINCNKLTGCPPPVVATFMKVLAEALSVNVVPLLPATLKKLREEEEPTEESSIEKLISAQQVALEVMINLLCADDEGVNWDVSSSDNSDNEHFPDTPMECEDMEPEFSCSVSTEVHEALVNHNFLTKVLAKVQFLDEELKASMHKCETGQRIYKNFMTLQSRALFCLNNLATCMDLQELGGAEEMYKLWIGLGQFIFQQSSELKLEVLESATGAMSAILRKLVKSELKQFEQFSTDDVHKLFDIVRRIDDSRIKVNVIRIVGALGCLLSTSTLQNSASVIKLIGSFLLEVGNGKNNELCVELEALDALLDVFSEDATHPLSVEIGLVSKLRSIVPSLNRKINCQRKSIGNHLPVANEIKDNLVKFIKYKSNFAASCNGNGHCQ